MAQCESSIEIPEWVLEAPEYHSQRFYLPAPLVCSRDFRDRDYTYEKCMQCYNIGHAARECTIRGELRLQAWHFDDEVTINDLIFQRNEEIQYLYSNREYYKYRTELSERKTKFLIEKIKIFADNNIADCAHCPLYRQVISYYQKQNCALMAELMNKERFEEVLPSLQLKIAQQTHLRDVINVNFDEQATKALDLLNQPWLKMEQSHFDCKSKYEAMKSEVTYWVMQAIEWRNKRKVGLNDCILPIEKVNRMMSFVQCNKCGCKGDHLPEDCPAEIVDDDLIDLQSVLNENFKSLI